MSAQALTEAHVTTLTPQNIHLFRNISLTHS